MTFRKITGRPSRSKVPLRSKLDAEVVIAGDVGGTNARFAFFDLEGKHALHQEVLPSRSFASFEAALGTFLANAPQPRRIRATSIGIAGPIVDQRVKTTNLPWRIDAHAVSRDLDLRNVTLLNDLVAVGLGALSLPPRKLTSLHKGFPKRHGGNLAAIAAGTGLGEAAFIWDGQTHVPCPSEGSHVDFAPRTPIEQELFDLLAAEFGHVSYERVASGSTISVIYEFFVREQRVRESKRAASFVGQAPDPNAAVVELAVNGTSEAAMRAVEMWASVYGAEAGNLALKSLATAGVYVCGGVSVHLAGVLAHGLPARRRGGASASRFVEAFVDKGRMRPLLEKIPICVVLEPLAGLRGAAAHAARIAAATIRTR
ncbi:Glucokinase [Labilithrix luteola]|uniref:Glucokinase n=1 Tax=Labilithrix luteola TaxID=1391654 RepID=A0A0K1Q7U2_9BACT|nr:glucokinase [Labilithrix luteola]AKV01886.1 Glucokinase [Labilithrix luteola]